MPEIERAAFVEQAVIEAVGLLVPPSVIKFLGIQFGTLYGVAFTVIGRNVGSVIIARSECARIQIVQPVYLPGDLQLGAQRPSLAHTSGKLIRPGVVVGVEHERERQGYLSDLHRMQRDSDVGYSGQMAYRVVDVAH